MNNPENSAVVLSAENGAAGSNTPAVTAENGAAGSPPVAGVTQDAAGIVYDPAKHIPKMNRKSGRWMPRGGRKPGQLNRPAAAPNPALIDAPAPDFSDLKKLLDSPPAAPSPEKEPAKELELVDATTEAGKVASHAAQMSAGVLLRAPDAAKAAPGEHEQMAKATAAYVRSKGWQASAGFALFLVFMAYLFRVLQNPTAQKTFSGWFEPKAPPAPAPRPQEAAAKPSNTAPAAGDLPPNLPPLARP